MEARARGLAALDPAGTPGWAGGVMGMLRLATQLVGINLLVIAGTLAGGIVLGLAPSASAARDLTARLGAGAPSSAVWSEFWAHWRSRFRRANAVVLPFWVAGGVLLLDLLALQGATGGVRAALIVALVVGGGYLLVALTYAPMVIGDYADPWAASIRFVILAPALYPLRGLAILVVWAAVALVYATFTPLALLYGLALPLLLTGWLTASALASRARVQA